MAFNKEPHNQMVEIVKQLDSITSLLQRYQKEKSRIDTQRIPTGNQMNGASVSTSFINGSSTSERSFYHPVPHRPITSRSCNSNHVVRGHFPPVSNFQNTRKNNNLVSTSRHSLFLNSNYSRNFPAQNISKTSIVHNHVAKMKNTNKNNTGTDLPYRYFGPKNLSKYSINNTKINSVVPRKQIVVSNTPSLSNVQNETELKSSTIRKSLFNFNMPEIPCAFPPKEVINSSLKLSNKFSNLADKSVASAEKNSEANELHKLCEHIVASECDINKSHIDKNIITGRVHDDSQSFSSTPKNVHVNFDGLVCINLSTEDTELETKYKFSITPELNVTNESTATRKSVQSLRGKKTELGSTKLIQNNAKKLIVRGKTLNKISLSAKKKSPIKVKKIVCSKFKVINKNRCFTVKSKTPAKTSLKAFPTKVASPLLKVQKLPANRYKKINNKTAIIGGTSFDRSKQIPVSKKLKVSPSVYGTVKKEKANVKYSWKPKDIKITREKGNGDIACAAKQEFKTLISVNENSFKTEQNFTSVLVKQKINRLKFDSEIGDYDLTDLSPTELVSLDTSSLLKLSKLLESSNNVDKSFIKNSKYKLVSKPPSLSKKVAKTIKAKYQINKRQNKSRSWRKSNTFPNHSKNCHNNRFKTGYRKKYAFKSSYKGFPTKTNRNANFVVIGGIGYRTSRTKMTKTGKKTRSRPIFDKKGSRIVVVRGERYKMDPTGKSLKKLSGAKNCQTPLRRIDLGGKTYINKGEGILMETLTPKIHNLASRVLHRSIQRVWASAAKKADLKKNNAYCMFFNRFGKCNRGTACPYVHDPSKIAVCTRFLRGTCKVESCPFSHEKAPGKMAICSFFLQGVCKNEDCPYRHEKLDPDAKLCKAFVCGYCPLGVKCKKAHVLVCPQYIHGKCDKGDSCLYPHPPQREKKSDNDSKINVKCEKEKLKVPEPQQKLLGGEKEEEEDKNSDDDCDFRYFNFKSLNLKKSEKDKADCVQDCQDDSTKIICRPLRQKLEALPHFIPLS